MKRTSKPAPQFAICIDNAGYAASLELRKIYRIMPDAEARRLHQIRIVDESGEDYLYPENCFIAIEFPQAVEEALRRAS